MALIGLTLDRNNPQFTITDFTFWMPQFSKFMATDEGKVYFNKLYPLANKKVFYSIFGTDWELAMSLVIAHYVTLIALQMQTPQGETLDGITGGTVTRGVLASATIGGFSKSYDIDKTMSDADDAKFWNATAYGQQFMALRETKAVPSVFVVTNNAIPDNKNRKW